MLVDERKAKNVLSGRNIRRWCCDGGRSEAAPTGTNGESSHAPGPSTAGRLAVGGEVAFGGKDTELSVMDVLLPVGNSFSDHTWGHNREIVTKGLIGSGADQSVGNESINISQSDNGFEKRLLLANVLKGECRAGLRCADVSTCLEQCRVRDRCVRVQRVVRVRWGDAGVNQ